MFLSQHPEVQVPSTAVLVHASAVEPGHGFPTEYAVEGVPVHSVAAEEHPVGQTAEPSVAASRSHFGLVSLKFRGTSAAVA